MTAEPHEWKCDGDSLARIVEEVRPSDARSRELALLRAVAQTVAVGGDADHLARTLRLHPRALVRATADAGLPPARRLLAWFRVLLAAKLLEMDGMTVARAAERCGYASKSSLARAVKEFTSLPPGALSITVEGPFAVAAAAFSEELVRHRALRGDRRHHDAKGTDA